jgi:DNA-binding HxlR family transcriptional regulator
MMERLKRSGFPGVLMMKCSQEHHHCGAAKTLKVLGDKWTLPLLHHIAQGKNRFGQLQRLMKGISAKTLTFRLRELEQAGILTRKVFPGLPLHVEYALTEKGKALGKVMLMMDEWGEKAE